MQIADLHLHSHFSRATSKDMTIHELARNAKIKGLHILGTGDFTHPRWLEDLKILLKNNDDGSGIYSYEGIKFVLSGEISLIYSQDGKTRKVHNVLLAPNFEVVDQINDFLRRKGRLDYDGRPIFGFSCIELVDQLMRISQNIEIIPAHAWTPWFSIFGSMSGFNSVEECFQDRTKYIYALETGLSSDPAMNWRISSLDKYNLVSFSDSHSPYTWRIGREACVFDMPQLTYKNIIEAIRTRKHFSYTIEVQPEYGKYHNDGHRFCNININPKEAMQLNNICPVCKKPLTIGVLHRVEELADREEGYQLEGAVPFKSLIPLMEIIAAVEKTGMVTKKVNELYNILINRFGSEFNVLLNAESSELKKIVKDKLAEAIIANRSGKVKIIPGFDGVYGKPQFDIPAEKKERGLGNFF
ncbi:MAG: DNA helicase UvrD [Candidatus Aenigmarchaeota archaeon]|nr:DNA helicase UvrD [Candidatus Aenigmarchaeota archaeon]